MKSVVITVVFLVSAVKSLPSITSPLPLTPVTDDVPLFPFGVNAGDSKLPRVDDGSSSVVVLREPILFYGNQETSLYVNTNGVISFRSPFTDCCGSRAFPLNVSLIAPFWHDVNTLNGGEIYYRQETDPELLAIFDLLVHDFQPTLLFIATWDRVAPAAFTLHQQGLHNTFQVVLATDGDSGSVAAFLYGSVQWGENAQIGFNAGDNVRSHSIPIALTSLTIYIEDHSNIGIAGVYIYFIHVGSGTASGSGSASASASGSGSASASGSGSAAASGSGSASGSGFASASGSGSASASGSGSPTPDFLYPYGEDVGDIRLQPVDDGSSKEIYLDVPIVFYGKREFLAFVNSNGILSFQSEFTKCCPPRDFPLQSVPFIAPFWHDIDVVNGGNIYYRQTSDTTLINRVHDYLVAYSITPQRFFPEYLLIVTWDRVAPFSFSQLQRNTFQLVIATDGVISSTFFLYGDIQWGEEAQIGFNAGDGSSSFSLPGALTEATLDIDEQSNIYRPGMFMYRIDNLELVTTPTALPPTTSLATTVPTKPPETIALTTVAPTTVPIGPSPLFAPYGFSVGDLYVTAGDDTSVGPIFLNQSFVFFGKNENEAYIGTNGVISFQMRFTECCGTREFPRGPPPLIAPFWHDVSTSNGGNIFYRQTSDPLLLSSFQSFVTKIYSSPFNPRSTFIVTWDRVAPFSNFIPDLSNTFQVWLGSDSKASFALFLYGDILWGENAQIGFNAGDNNRSFSIVESLTDDTVNVEHHSNINETSVFLFRVDNLLASVTTVCPLGRYQPEPEGDCFPCPLNTNITVENATICPCLPGFFRTSLEGPESDCTQPPRSCQNIRVISMKERSVNISWERPAITGRDDFYYTLEYSGGEGSGSHPVVSHERVVQYLLSGLTPATDYTITVTVENGVSNQDPHNEHLRSCELRLTTMEGRPSPPIDFQSLCNVIVWGEPLNANGDITVYEAQFYIPGTQLRVFKEIAQDKTFYIIDEEDKLGGDVDTFVRVRAKTQRGPSQWSEGRSLGCDDVIVTTSPRSCPPCNCLPCPPVLMTEPPLTTMESTPSVYFELGGQTYGNNSVVSLTEVGEGGDALLCKTDLINCCATIPNRFGHFYYPNGVMVPINNSGHGFYRNRGEQEIRLNRRQGIISPVGKFRCEIPDASGVLQNIYITLIL